MQTSLRSTCFITLLVLAAAILLVSRVQAQAEAPTTNTTILRSTVSDTVYVLRDQPRSGGKNDRKGFLIGFNVGAGGGGIGYSHSDEHVSEDPVSGAFGGLRLGYAVSNSIVLGVEPYGFGSDEDDEKKNWGAGAAFATLTWHPGGSGFFLRAGIGGGGGDIVRASDGKKFRVEDAPATLFSLGYEWRLARRFALGLSVEGIGLELKDLDVEGIKEDHWAGMGGMTLQFNWYL